LHQPLADTGAAASTVHDQFGNVGAMGLIRSPGGMQLNAADDSFNVTGDEKDRPPFDCLERSSPPLFGAILCERGKEADRSAGIYGID